MSLRIPALALSAVLIMLTPVASAAEPVIKPGNWRVSFQMDIPGLPIKMKPIVVNQCITEEDASDPNKTLPAQSKDEKCKVVDHEIDGNRITWAVRCEGQEDVSSRGEMTLAEDSYDGVIRVMNDGQELTTKLKGKRLGDCQK
jgi:hypothetical protein